MRFCGFAVQFGVGVRGKIYLAHGATRENVATGACDCRSVGGERHFERSRFDFFEIRCKARMQRGFSENVEENVLGTDFCSACDAFFKKFRWHERALGVRRRFVAWAETAS